MTVNLATGAVGYGRSGPRQPAPGDEFATGDELRATDAAHLAHRAGWTVPRIMRVQPVSNATITASAQPRKHRESVLTVSFIVSSAAPLPGQARHSGKYSRAIAIVGMRDCPNRRRP